MDAIVKKFYADYRKQGFRPEHSLSAARTRKQWEALESAGFVRLAWVTDCDTYDDSYIDTWTDVRESERERARKDLWEQIERDGVWGLVGEYRFDPEDDEGWDSGDAIYGLVGQDDAGYATDIMATTIDTFRFALKNRCPKCGRPAKVA